MGSGRGYPSLTCFDLSRVKPTLDSVVRFREWYYCDLRDGEDSHDRQCSRLILNMRCLTGDGTLESTIEPMATMGTIHFKRTVPQNTIDLPGIELEARRAAGRDTQPLTRIDFGSLLAMEFAENSPEDLSRRIPVSKARATHSDV